MQKPVRIALDVMGGDHGASVTVPGAALALAKHPDALFVMFGEEAIIAPLLDAHPGLKAVTTFTHTPISVKMTDKPSQALRQGRRTSSMWMTLKR